MPYGKNMKIVTLNCKRTTFNCMDEIIQYMNKEKVDILLNLLVEIKDQLDHECCQTLMDADTISSKIEKTIQKL